MNLYDYLELTKKDYDTTDVDYDTIVTVCHIGESNDNYDKFCNGLMKKVDVMNASGEYLVVNWSSLINVNIDKFRAFSKENWRVQYEDEDEFVYQWIIELHSYLAGMVSDAFYQKLISFVDGLTPCIAKNYIVCIDSSYVRDAQAFHPEESSDEGDDNNWRDYAGSIFLGVYKWNVAYLGGLRQYVAKLHKLQPTILEIIPVE